MNRHKLLAVFLLVIGVSNLFAQLPELFRIVDVTYDIKGSTREFPLTLAVPIDLENVYADKVKFEFYLADLGIQLQNQRVFESSSIDAEYGIADANGIVPVKLTVHTIDTWNIIVLPYPKYDSNDGFNLKLKLKNYNFFGSMQQLNGDVNYAVDNDGKSTLEANLDFGIPFKAWGYSFNWDNGTTIAFPEGEIPEFNINTGLNVAVPLGKTAINFGAKQYLYINDRNDTELFQDDRYYFKDVFSTSLPVALYKFDYMGNFSWTPSASISTNWAFDGIQHADLQGPVVSWGHSLGLGRVDWRGNFRSGLTANVGNSYSYNIHNGGNIGVSVDGSLTGYTSVFNRVGLYSRAVGYYNFYDSYSEDAGDRLRGILNNRISSDTAFTLNVDLPIRVMTVDFLEVTGVSWTRYIGFEMQASPFFDMALTHDAVTGRYFDLDDGWYSGGMEIIVFPKKMRSIYGRISVGFDLAELAVNGGQLSGVTERDGKSLRELLIGIGLHY